MGAALGLVAAAAQVFAASADVARSSTLFDRYLLVLTGAALGGAVAAAQDFAASPGAVRGLVLC